MQHANGENLYDIKYQVVIHLDAPNTSIWIDLRPGGDVMTTALQAADFFISAAKAENRSGQMTNMKVNKLVYFAQAASLQKRGKPLFTDKIEAWDHGPVVYNVYEQFKPYGRKGISEQSSPDAAESISGDDIDLLAEVSLGLGGKTASQLRNRSHREDGPWCQTMKKHVRGAEIDLNLIKDWVKKHPVLPDADSDNDVLMATLNEDGEVVVPAGWQF